MRGHQLARPQLFAYAVTSLNAAAAPSPCSSSHCCCLALPQASGSGGGLPPAPLDLSTGLTPQVGALDVLPGIEGIVPSNQPLSGGQWALGEVGGSTARACASACVRETLGDV